MAWASTPKVVLGCIAFTIFWIMAVFPKVSVLPIGRTAGSLVGAALMVVFQILSPKEAFAAVDLPILGLLFGTMVVSVYLQRADLFKHLGSILSWKSYGGKDLLCRVCLLSAISSAFFTNDTTCVIFTAFLLKLCKQKNLHPEPFLMALASSANIGSAATPIGNPQNLIIAVQSKISFGKFLLGILPAVVVGLVVNTVGLVLMYWKQLSVSKIVEEKEIGLADKNKVKQQLTDYLHTGSLPSEPKSMTYESEVVRDPSVYPPSDMVETEPTQRQSSGELMIEDTVHNRKHQDFNLSKREDLVNASNIAKVLPIESNYTDLDNKVVETSDTREGGSEADEIVPSRHSFVEINDLLSLELRPSFSRPSQLGSRGSITAASLAASASIDHTLTEHADDNDSKLGFRRKLRKRIWKISVYLVTVGMLAALLSGLDLTWTAITGAVILMVLDFSDAGPSLDQVSYALLVFFSGMFITVDGFNKTGAPGQFWNAVEPHSRINTVKGLTVLSLVVILLSNVASNVPTVLLLGVRIAASAGATPGASVSKAWLILAWVSTVAGNLTLLGSAANLIVSEQARRAVPSSIRYNLSFWNHLKFGVPGTLVVIAVGLPLIQS